MDLTNIETIKKLCQQYGIYPSKKLGQSFLINKVVLDKIIQAGDLSEKDMVLEIGPGFGVLTGELVKHAGKVVAIEKDKRLAEFLLVNNQQSTINNKLKITNDDILKLLNCYIVKLLSENYKIISNLPYQITSPVLWKFLHNVGTRHGAFRPELMVLMVQKEVAERIVAKPGQMSVLAALCQFYAKCEKICDVDRENFWPAPEVDSAIIKLKIRPVCWLHVSDWSRGVASSQRGSSQETGANIANIAQEKEFFKIVKIGFSAKRKMLKNNLSNGLKIPQEKIIKILKKVGLNEKVRAQELSVEDWIDMFALLDKK